ncbi:MAG: outer membrane protein assembly factor BamD [Paracoccaceae bacterium]|nr:outer membrane protein assembly factor BamD [Paracoccaceae bacterium]RZO36438.1 MAG: outer membrane protein assembly factor BamD [Paracoccaceae bacterium]|tara:strand:+ start:325 stop:1170 length:846 start_codon:yes stop_codon:yes gene_type:complete
MNSSKKSASKINLILGLTLLFVLGCVNIDEDIVLEDLSAREIFINAEKAWGNGDNEKAAELFLEIERIYPYSELAKQALLNNAIVLQLEKDYEGSRLSANRFITFYPADKNTPYAYYLLALSYYDQIDEIGRDQANTYEALKLFRIIIERYPESKFSSASSLKKDLAFDHLAAKEMEVGRYYLKNSHYIAAINRFETVVKEYPTTSHTPEALHRLVEAYLSLGLEGEATVAAAILGHNFKSSLWYQESYNLLGNEDINPNLTGFRGWLGDIYRQVIRGEWI